MSKLRKAKDQAKTSFHLTLLVGAGKCTSRGLPRACACSAHMQTHDAVIPAAVYAHKI
eukprot:SAG22_NODE_4_length_44774_cov_362.122149_34_plen_58_part_00